MMLLTQICTPSCIGVHASICPNGFCTRGRNLAVLDMVVLKAKASSWWVLGRREPPKGANFAKVFSWACKMEISESPRLY